MVKSAWLEQRMRVEGGVMICPVCGNEMFLCTTFGTVWSCECGNTEKLTEEEQKFMGEFGAWYRLKLDNRNPKDIERGKSLRQERVAAEISMRDLAHSMGTTPTQISSWEMGLEPMEDHEMALMIAIIKKWAKEQDK